MPSTIVKGRMSHKHKFTRVMVILAMAKSVGNPRMVPQTNKLPELAAIVVREHEWALIDDVRSLEMYM